MKHSNLETKDARKMSANIQDSRKQEANLSLRIFIHVVNLKTLTRHYTRMLRYTPKSSATPRLSPLT